MNKQKQRLNYGSFRIHRAFHRVTTRAYIHSTDKNITNQTEGLKVNLNSRHVTLIMFPLTFNEDNQEQRRVARRERTHALTLRPDSETDFH